MRLFNLQVKDCLCFAVLQQDLHRLDCEECVWVLVPLAVTWDGHLQDVNCWEDDNQSLYLTMSPASLSSLNKSFNALSIVIYSGVSSRTLSVLIESVIKLLSYRTMGLHPCGRLHGQCGNRNCDVCLSGKNLDAPIKCFRVVKIAIPLEATLKDSIFLS